MKTPEKIKARRASNWKAYYEKHKERLKVRSREYAIANKEKHKEKRNAYRRKHYAANKQWYAAKRLRLLEKYPDIEKKHSAKWRKNHPEKRKEVCRRYSLKNRHKSLHNAHVRRQKIMANPLDQNEKMAIQGFLKLIKILPYPVCMYCQKVIPMSAKREMDHIIPISRGGLHCYSNLTVSCQRCNRSKGANLLSEWANRPHYKIQISHATPPYPPDGQ